MARHFQPHSKQFYKKIGVVDTDHIQSASKHIIVDNTYLTGVDLEPTQMRTVTPQDTNRIQSPIPFDKQISRPEAPSALDVHPLRFVPFNNQPAIHSNNRRIVVPKMGQSSPRGESFGVRDLSNQPEYDANDQPVRRRPASLIPFGKLTGRREPRQNSFNHSHKKPNYGSVDPKVRSYSLEKELPRPHHSTLPSFMLQATYRQGL